MHFSIELSLIIDEELRKKGIDRKIRSFDPGFCVFTYDELDKITSLELSCVSSLEGLELLPNLRKLIIKSPDFSNVSSDVDINDSNIKIDGLFINNGYGPITNFVKDLNITNEKGYIITDEKGKTKIDGIYACGDSKQKDLYQIITAASEGALAATAAYKFIKNIQ